MRQALASSAFIMLSTVVAHGGVGTFTVDPSSTLTDTTTVAVPIAGTLKGNYDATTNPGGTQTRPGLFGGSGNVPIPYTSNAQITMQVSSSPIGAFAIVADATGSFVTGLSLDLLGTSTGTVSTTLTVNWNTFHTVAPTAMFPGGTPVSVPVENGAITNLIAVQNGPAPLVMIETAPGVFNVSGVVPVAISYEATLMGTPYMGTDVPSSLALGGVLTVTAAGSTFVADASTNETVPVPAATTGFVDQPMAVPTVLPAGSTANLLLSGIPGAGTSTTNLTAHLVATAPAEPARPADLDQDGVVAGADLAIMLALWGHAGTAADLNSDGIVAGEDLAMLLSAWGS